MNASEFQILCPVTAEVAGSSPVVPAIHSKRLIGIGGIQKGVQKGHQYVSLLHPFLYCDPVTTALALGELRVVQVLCRTSPLEKTQAT